MQNLYEALGKAHPGFEVVDVKFMFNPGDADDQKPNDLDPLFSTAVENAVEVDPASFQ